MPCMTAPSPLAAFAALVAFSFRRLWRVRQMGWVAVGLLAVLTATVAVITHGPAGWGLPDRYSFRFQTKYRDLPRQRQENGEHGGRGQPDARPGGHLRHPRRQAGADHP